MYKTLLKFFYLTVGYVIATGGMFYLMHKFQITSLIPDNSNLLNWDAKWYDSIRTSGYVYIENAQCNLAFFPLFPLVWSIINVPPVWISVGNGIVFLGSFYFLFRGEKFSYLFFSFLLTIPSFIFFYLPYSESLFFLFCTFIVIGYKQKSNAIKLIGFFFSSMARSVSVIFIPAIIICELLVPSDENSWKTRILNVTYSCLASMSGLAVTILLQGWQTGKWFYFTSVMKYWGRKWIIPGFPLTTGNPSKMLAIDGIAFMIGLIAVVFCIKWTITLLFSSKRLGVPSYVMVSALFLSAITVLDTIHTNNTLNSANLWSLNRHLTTTVFAVVFLHWLYRWYHPGKREKIFGVLLLLSGTFIIGFYEYPMLLIDYSAFFATLICLKFKIFKSGFLLIPLTWQLVIQLITLEIFLSYNWVG